MIDDDDFWERTWNERRESAEAAFGASEDMVMSFSWKDRVIPGACAVTFPPHRGERGAAPRNHWLYLTMGLSQPVSAAEVQKRRAQKDGRSGRGYELAIATRDESPWVAEALYELITYFTAPGARAPGIGHRVMFGIYEVAGKQHPFVGGVDQPPVGDLRALLLWPYRVKSFLLTTTGKADVLCATGITGDEWELAKSTSSPHLVLLLDAGHVGQITDLDRMSATRDPDAKKAWDDLRGLTAQEAEARLRQGAHTTPSPTRH
jgi:hypothetical protein